MINEIRVTKNYKKFRFFDCNRDIKPRIVEKLIGSIKKIGYVETKPIIVDKNFKIIDGQNRFVACQKLNLPISYVMSNNTKESIPYLNSCQDKWTTEDYCKFFSKNNKNSYKLLLEIVKKSGATISGVMAALDCRNTKNIQNGKFKLIGDSDKLSEIVKDRLNLCYFIRGKKGISRKICLAINYLDKLDSFDYDLFKQRLRERKNLMHTCDSTNDYIKLFMHIYNFRKVKYKMNNVDIAKVKFDKF